VTTQAQHAAGGPDRPAASRDAKISGLRANSFAALVMLLIEFGLGSWVNLYAHLPASDHGQGTVAAFGDAVASGPVGLSIHALLGTLLIITAISAVVRAVLVRQAVLIALAALALLAIAAAWLAGARFTGDSNTGASLGMAIATGIAMLGYASILLTAPATAGTTPR
jgi:hypothetical protein